MAKFTKTLIAAGLLAAAATPAFAADYSGDIHKNDYKWFQFNIMHTIDQRPMSADDGYNDTYFEMEFGGRSGIFDLYGYVDIFDIFDSKHSDKHDGDNLFIKFAPRVSLDALTGQDLSFGPVQEVYVASLFNIGGAHGLNESLVGLGTDVQVPWFGKVGMNLYKRHVNESGSIDDNGVKVGVSGEGWNGQQFSMNWFKPFYTFSNGSFVSYQGYLDYAWGMKETSHSDGLATFHALYWHSDRYAVGYGLKYFNEVYGINNGQFGLSTTGFGHYFDVTYKF
ncbi:outer membrane protein [Aeromonas caviae]|jgi:nucleoside-specific channel-forming protein|uniref:nucleoside-specific channel-forming Tsx family protein n=1 Tax=Aeromonas hydrophila TaxID=644 RepID=UPI0020839B83|nr:outer membrane protein OmpK [Aeromonas hydrophila]MDE8811193.1 outer membrane protein OmpK [Aeromonas hydrophila]GKQ60772.1 outer membrane protein [Aeromonas caviae]